MAEAFLKICPKCHALVELSALRCNGCSHLFRARPARPTDKGTEVEPERRCFGGDAAAAGLPPLAPIWAAARTVALVAIAGLLGAAATWARGADHSGLHVTCGLVALSTAIGALCSLADYLAVLNPGREWPALKLQ